MNSEQKKNILLEKADELAHEVYKVSKNFPREELFGLISQIRRAAISVPLNVIEGFARQGSKEYIRFLEISYASLKETKYLMHFAYIEKYISSNNYNKLINLSEEIGKILLTKIKKLKNKIINS